MVAHPVQDMPEVSIAPKAVGVRLSCLRCGAIAGRHCSSCIDLSEPSNEFYENPHLAMRRPTHCGGLTVHNGRLWVYRSLASLVQAWRGLSRANRRDPSRTASEWLSGNAWHTLQNTYNVCVPRSRARRYLICANAFTRSMTFTLDPTRRRYQLHRKTPTIRDRYPTEPI